MSNEETLKKFYRKWYEWAISGGGENPYGFRHDVGLCTTLAVYLHRQGREYLYVAHTMADDFAGAGLSRVLPFNKGIIAFADESRSDSCHQNPLRLEWCRARME